MEVREVQLESAGEVPGSVRMITIKMTSIRLYPPWMTFLSTQIYRLPFYQLAHASIIRELDHGVLSTPQDEVW